MSLVLYHGWTSSASRRVRLFLEEKGLTYESHEIDLAAQQQHSPEYLRINPNGVIPAIIHDGRALHESATICEYIDEVFPEPPLCPSDPYDRARMRNWVRHVDGLIGNLIRFNWRHRIQKRAESMSDEELEQMIARIPSPERREAWRRVARNPYTETELAQSRSNLEALVREMESMMTGGWLIGGAYSLADIAVVPFIARISEEISPSAVTQAVNPKVTKWWAAIQARPAFERARIDPFMTA
ncbi:glutathione S-transferase family protein [Orrella marina]|uniref:Glutathione S-transferase family protein n=1 Tax=Orrella marina TaxID=2163011 RepID=A0A2R4XG86_9BURK|nr:glutathione S-transferase family protein [Orrella marina]AWB32817.1 glutathione S-transferase family protein [Orrella marina]